MISDFQNPLTMESENGKCGCCTQVGITPISNRISTVEFPKPKVKEKKKKVNITQPNLS